MIFGLETVGVTLGDSVVIYGAGSLGLYSIALAREMGASEVIVVDRVDERLKMAKSFGAEVVVNSSESSTVERIERVKALTDGGADLVVEVAGAPSVVNEGLSMVRNSGRYLEIGSVQDKAFASIDISMISVRGLKIVGTLNYEPWVIPRALDFLRRNSTKYPFKEMCRNRFRLDDINAAFEAAAMKIVQRAAVTP